MMKKKILLGIFLSTLLFLFAKTFFSYSLFYNTTCGMKNLILEGEVDNLYIGSSMFRQGLDINELKKEIPEESHYILAYNGNQPIWECLQLEYLLESGLKVKKLYVDMYAFSICKEPNLDDEKMFLEFPYDKKREIYQCIKSGLSWTEKWQLWVSGCNEMILFWPIYSKIVDMQFENGGTLINSEGSEKETLDNMFTVNYPSTMDNTQIEYLKKIVKLAKENKIQIVFVETPKYSKVQYEESYCKLMDEYREILDCMGVEYISDYDEIDCYDSSLFQDLIHLSSEGRKTFTKVLCDMIREGKY